MEIDSAELRRHYSQLSDEELLALDCDDLTAAARNYVEQECSRRGLARSAEPEPSAMPEPDSLGESRTVRSYVSYAFGMQAGEAERDCEILHAAGIPCRLEGVVLPPIKNYQRTRIELHVPVAMSFMADSVLDKEAYNAEHEAEFRNTLETLSDEEFRALTPDLICSGIQDRLDCLRRVYREEAARRATAPPPDPSQ
jgi:hypothetical protein